MNTIGSHLNKHEEIPIFFRDPLFYQFKPLFGHGINLTQQVFFIVGAEIRHVYQVFADNSLNFLHRTGRIRIGLCGICGRGCEETSDLNTVDRFRWKRLWHANCDYFLPKPRKNITDAISFHGAGIRQCMLLIRVIAAIAETIKPQCAWVFAGHHRTPGGNGNGRDAAFELPPHAFIHDPFEIRQFVAHLVKHQFRRCAIQSNHQDFLSPIHESLSFSNTYMYLNRSFHCLFDRGLALILRSYYHYTTLQYSQYQVYASSGLEDVVKEGRSGYKRVERVAFL